MQGAAGIDYPLAGPYVDIDDHDGLTEDMEFARAKWAMKDMS